MLLKISKFKLWLYGVDTSFKYAGRFIDLETFIKNENDTEFFKATLKPKIPFIKIPDEVKTYAVAKFILDSAEVKKNYPYIYEPQYFGSNGEVTQGTLAREEFANHYGGYMEMVYLLCNQNLLKVDDVFEMETNQFLFLSEYLIRKRLVESLK